MSRYHEVYARWQRDPEGLLGRGRQGHRLDQALATRSSTRTDGLDRWFAGAELQHLLQRRRPPRRAPAAATSRR